MVQATTARLVMSTDAGPIGVQSVTDGTGVLCGGTPRFVDTREALTRGPLFLRSPGPRRATGETDPRVWTTCGSRCSTRAARERGTWLAQAFPPRSAAIGSAVLTHASWLRSGDRRPRCPGNSRSWSAAVSSGSMVMTTASLSGPPGPGRRRRPVPRFLAVAPHRGSSSSSRPSPMLGAAIGDAVTFALARASIMGLRRIDAVLVALVAGRTRPARRSWLQARLYAVWSTTSNAERSTDLPRPRNALLLLGLLAVGATRWNWTSAGGHRPGGSRACHGHPTVASRFDRLWCSGG